MNLLKANSLDIDETKLATLVTKKEGKVKSLTVAQVKEVQKILLDILATHPDITDMRLKRLLHKHRK